MKNNTSTKNREYTSPLIERIIIDHEITLQLESTPPVGPGGETVFNTPEYFKNDPFKVNFS